MAKSLVADMIKRKKEKLKAEAKQNVKIVGEAKNVLKAEQDKEVQIETKVIVKETRTLNLD